MTYAKDLMLRHYDTQEDYDAFLRAVKMRSDASTYLIFTEQMRVYSWYFGVLPWDAFPNLKAHLFADKERWEPLFDGQGITVFVHRVHPNDG
jgi:chloramphenicol O-acetyltransferase